MPNFSKKKQQLKSLATGRQVLAQSPQENAVYQEFMEDENDDVLAGSSLLCDPSPQPIVMMVPDDHEKSSERLSMGGNTSGSASGSGGSSQGGLVLPVQRVKMIMKSCPDVESVQQESLHIVAKATELFIAHLTRESFKCGGAAEQQLDYEHLSELVKSSPQLEFLEETIPGKITWAKCQKLMANEKTNVADYI